MGGSESRCCTDVPQEKKSTDKINFTGDSDDECVAERTRIVQFDPRSPSQVIDRTPIEIPVTPVQTKPLMRVQPMIENNIRNRHNPNENKNQDHDTFIVDPRSPGPPGCRTPISSKPNEMSFTKPSKIVYSEPALVDPRSPSQGIVRTPLLNEEAHYEDNFIAQEGDICETPKKPHGETNKGFTTENGQEMDPRSPTQGFDRTPVSKLENPDHQTNVVSARNMHDPRSPTTEVSRTPLGALFSGHRELRRTVLMTNALMASPLNKKGTRQDMVTESKDVITEPETVESFDECEDDEIPAILCCNFDPLNNSCSSSMVASIGSEVDCISLNESFEGLISTTDTADVGLMESLLQNMDEVALEAEERDQYGVFDSGYHKFEDVESPMRFSEDIPQMTEKKMEENEQQLDSMGNEDHSKQNAFALVSEPNIGSKLSVEEERHFNTDEHIIDDKPHIDQADSDIADCNVDNELKESKNVDSQNMQYIFPNSDCFNCIDNDKENEISSVQCEVNKGETGVDKENYVSSNCDEKQIEEIVSDLISMADDTDLISNKSKTEDDNIKPSDAKDELNLTFEKDDRVSHESNDLAEDFNEVFESCENNEIGLKSIQADDKDITEHEVSSGEEPINNKENMQILEKDDSKSDNTKDIITPSDKKDSVVPIKTTNQEQDKGPKKPSRKLKSPCKVTNRRKLANDIVAETVQVATAQVKQSTSIRKPSMIRKPKAKSASSDDGRVRRTMSKSGEGQENMQRSVKILSARKSDSKLVGPASVRSPLAVLTNDLNSPNHKGKFSNSPSRPQTKLPRYQGTPPIVSNRSLSVSFSGGRSTKRSQSGERPRTMQRSFHHDKEN